MVGWRYWRERERVQWKGRRVVVWEGRELYYYCCYYHISRVLYSMRYTAEDSEASGVILAVHRRVAPGMCLGAIGQQRGQIVIRIVRAYSTNCNSCFLTFLPIFTIFLMLRYFSMFVRTTCMSIRAEPNHLSTR